jgi:hypothetical protein
MAKDIKDIKRELDELRAKFDKDTAAALDRTIARLESGNASLSEWNTQLDLFKIKADVLADDLDYVAQSLSQSVTELIKGNESINQQVKSTRKLSSIAQQLLSMRRGDATYDLKKLKNLQQQTLQHKRILQAQLSQTIEGSIERAALQDKIEQTNIILDKNKELVKEARKFQRSIGITGAILKGMSNIPILGDLLDVQDALEASEEAANNGAGRLGSMAAAAKSIGKSLTFNLTDPLVVGGLLVKAFTTIKDLLFSADSTAESLARGMNMTYTAALNTFEQLHKINGDTLATAKDYSETLNFVGGQLGSNASLNEKDLITFTKLRIQAGLTNEELMGATKLSLANGGYLEDNVNIVLKTTTALNKQKGVYLNEKTILKDIGNVSAATTLTLGKNTKEITKAVATAKALGMEMSKLESISNSLLNFEQSIEDELSAELLTGKNINLERARLAALNGDIATLAEEINSQIGSSADFTKMNVLQQEALAKAVGMNREELAQTLFTQEQLKGLSKDEAARRQEVLDKRIEEVGLAQAQRELESGTIDALEQQAGIQTQINQFIEQVKETFATEFIPYLKMAYEWFQGLVTEAGGMDKLVISIKDKISGMVTFAKEFVRIWIAIKAAQLAYNTASAIGLAIQTKQARASMAEAGAETASAAMKSVGWTPVVGVILATAAALSAYAALGAIMNDGIVPPAGGSGYGKRVLYGPEGSISLNNKDTVIAGTNLFGNDVKSEPNKPTQMGNAGAIKVQASGGGNDTAAIISAINALANRPINVSIDGKKVIEATTGAQPNTAGDENRKNSYKMS